MKNDPEFTPLPDGSVLHKPPNVIQRIDMLYAFMSVDEQGREGLCAVPMRGLPGPIPLITADKGRLESLIPIAQALANRANMHIRLVMFSARQDLDVIEPAKPAGNGG